MRPMHLTKTVLRSWIAFTSLSSFLVGWIMLAHSPKPVQASGGMNAPKSVAIRSVPILAPLPELDLSGNLGSGGAGAPQFNVQQSPPRFLSQSPLFTTGGS